MQGEPVRATRDFDPNSPDEIEIEKNDTIELQQRYNDGWGFGRNMRTGQHGVFPLNHVKPLSQREAEAIQSMFNGPTSGSDFHYGSSSSHASASRQAGDERHRNATVAGPVPKLTLQFEMEPADSVSDECMKLFDDIMSTTHRSPAKPPAVIRQLDPAALTTVQHSPRSSASDHRTSSSDSTSNQPS